MENVNVRRYHLNLGKIDDKCYCSAPNICKGKGVHDLTKCMGVELYGSHPHFLETDEIYLKQVEGLSPSPEKHIIEIMLEAVSMNSTINIGVIRFNVKQPLQCPQG